MKTISNDVARWRAQVYVNAALMGAGILDREAFAAVQAETWNELVEKRGARDDVEAMMLSEANAFGAKP